MADIGGRGGGGGGGGAPPSDLINKMINTLFISETNYSVTTSHVIFIVLESVMASKRVHSGSESILNYFSKKAKGNLCVQESRACHDFTHPIALSHFVNAAA